VLTYYSATAREDFWTEHWGGHTVEELLEVARTSPLTALITASLPSAGLVLEAGCGLGQYVILLRERGWRTAGVDTSLEALAACRHVAAVPLAASDLRALAIRNGAVAAYVSLGVVEHDPAGPDAILREARRVLEPGGVLVLSVPYVNGLRRLGAPWIRRRQRRIREGGGEFYQFAFSRAEARAFLGRHGFEVRRTAPYDPARALRSAWRRLSRRPRAGAGAVATADGPRPDAGAGNGGPGSRGAVKRALYSPPALALLGHMILFVAVKR
jgi:SAM-dependent methyltransferase